MVPRLPGGLGEIVVVLEPLEKGWMEELEKVGAEAKAELAAFRASP